jgi:hypothetical protein
MPILILTLVAHVLFTMADAYWLFPWLDMPVHFLIGSGLAIVFTKNFKWSTSTSIIAVIALAFGWEHIERLFGLAQALAESYHDAATDVAFGVMGGIIGSVLYSKKHAK